VTLRLARPVAVAVAIAAVAAAGCASDGEDGAEPETASGRSGREEARAPDRLARPRATPLPATRCPAGLANCRTASGRILYVERVDPDGDGDAHFVLASREAITAPGLSVVDVKRSLRPRPLPRPGDRLSAAGPVYTGSYGQRQIEAVALHVAR
jgi:hypothetical protein